jgi:anti-sigma regulatory factor (Ser/Thr protein kinase)
MAQPDDSLAHSDGATDLVINNDRDTQSFLCNPLGARSARAFVTQSLTQHGATAPLMRDFELVVGELTSNAVEHGVGSNIIVTTDFTDPQWWAVEVAAASDDVGDHILDPTQWSIAEPDAQSGRGLGITRRLMDDVSSKIESRRLTIRCRRRVSATAQVTV